MSFTTKPLTEDRIIDLVNLGEEALSISKDDVRFNREHAIFTARNSLTDVKWFVRLAYNPQPCGFIIGVMADELFAPKRMAIVDSLYVQDGTSNRAKIGKCLINEFEAWALNDANCNWLHVGENSGINPPAVDAFYRQLGFQRYGALYKRRIA